MTRSAPRPAAWTPSCTHGLAFVLLLALAPLAAATLPDGFNESTLVSGLSNPTSMAFAPDGRLFICEQGGALRVVDNGTLLGTPFLTVSVDDAGERGLLGIAFDPDFASNGHLYVYYTVPASPRYNRISRFTADGGNGNVAQAGSELLIMRLDDLSGATNHNGGALHFGIDGKLYVAVGDNANGGHAQDLSTRHGKMLRLNKDGTIPSDNPFYATTSGDNRAIWAQGLRNPFTFAVQPGSGRIHINDVGQNTWEEVNHGQAGGNYGWPDTEGYTSDPDFISPLFAYQHGSGNPSGCSITGGAFYNPPTTSFPATYHGVYFFGDYCNRWIRWMDPAVSGSSTLFASDTIGGLVDLKVGSDGDLFYLSRNGGGVVQRISYDLASPPAITQQPADQTVVVGATASFSVSASGTPPLSYQWQRDGSDISGATASSYSLGAQASDDGAAFRVVVSNAQGSVTSAAATLNVTANSAPTVAITSPAGGSTWAGGESIDFSGSASDPEDGSLPASAYSWRIDLHHGGHIHPAMPETSGIASGSWEIPTQGHTETDIWYRLHLTATDSEGASVSTSRDLFPRQVSLGLDSSPSGLELRLDGQPITAPLTQTATVGIERSLEAIGSQTAAGASWAFDSWSDGTSSASRTILVPEQDHRYRAVYRVDAGSVGSGDGLAVTYYDQIDLSGASVSRIDPVVAFDWGGGSPAPAIGVDTFSARWSGSVQAQFSETYTFHLRSDDGVRLWVDGQLIIDDWFDRAPAESSGSIALVAGQQVPIVLEYYENAGGAVSELRWSSASTPKSLVPRSQLYSGSGGGNGDGLIATYFDTIDLSGPGLQRVDPTVDFDWGYGSPDPAIASDTFSARWSGEVEAPTTATWTFSLRADDGVRLWVDGQLIIDRWIDQAPTVWSGSIALEAGQRYPILLEYYENGGGAVCELSWSSSGQPTQIVPQDRLYGSSGGDGLAVTYYDQIDLSGASISRVDPVVAFDWGGGSPDPAIGADTFSARWSGEVEAPATATWTFSLRADDGVRLWVDGQLIIDRWIDQAPTEWSGSITLEAGQRYPIVLEYYENYGGAVCELSWSSPEQPKQIVPQEQLSSSGPVADG